jgi:hypothetical protein
LAFGVGTHDRVRRDAQTEGCLRRARRRASNEQIHAAVGVNHAAIALTYADGGLGHAGAGPGLGNDGVVHPSGSVGIRVSKPARGRKARERR